MRTYTKDEIDNLLAGPEMDALVAEILGYNVLGITHCFPEPECTGYYLTYKSLEDWQIPGAELRPVYLYDCACEFAEPGDKRYFGHTAGCLEIVPEFSEDDCQSLEILKKYLWWKAESDLSEDGSICWHIRIGEPPNHKWFSGIGETIALAICRALLSLAQVSEKT